MIAARPLVIADTETTGLKVDDEVWEFALKRREVGWMPQRDRSPVDPTEKTWRGFLEHDVTKAERMIEPFRSDYLARFDPAQAISVERFREMAAEMFAGRPTLLGAVPDFDTAQFRRLLGANRENDPWHYHLLDVENLAIGYLEGLAKSGDEAARAFLASGREHNSEALSSALGVDPDRFARHVALGDVLWAEAMYDVVRLGVREVA